MKKIILLIGVIALLTIPLSNAVLTINDDWWGNKFDYISTSTSTISTAGSSFGNSFLCRNNITVTKVGVFIGGVAGTWTGKKLNIGIQNINSSGYYSRVYLRNASFTPVSNWNIITLNSSISLTKGNYYCVVVNDTYSVLSATVYIRINYIGTPMDSFHAYSYSGVVDGYDSYMFRTTNYNKLSLMNWLITDGVNYSGNPYTYTVAGSCYAQLVRKQLFTVPYNMTVDSLSVICRRTSLMYQPLDSLRFVLVDNATGNILRNGIVATIYESSNSGYGRWTVGKLNNSITLLTGTVYNIKFFSPSSTSTKGWYLTALSCETGITSKMGFQGNNSYYGSSTNNGTTWNTQKNLKIQFMFHNATPVCIPPSTSITIINNLTNCSGTSEYSLDGYNYIVWNNFTGTNTINKTNNFNATVELPFYYNTLYNFSVLPHWKSTKSLYATDFFSGYNAFIGWGDMGYGSINFTYRPYVYFNTSSLPNNISIYSANISFFIDSVDYVRATDFNMSVWANSGVSPHRPLELKDYWYGNYTKYSGIFNTTSYSTPSRYNIKLNLNGINVIDKNGLSKYVFRLGDDVYNSSWWNDGYYEGIVFSSPVLTVNYTASTICDCNSSGLWLFIGSALSIENSQFFLLILLSLWLLFVFKYIDTRNSAICWIQFSLSMPLVIMFTSYSYYNSIVFGYAFTIMIPLLSLYLIIDMFYKKGDKKKK
jgi:hypothetical protein